MDKKEEALASQSSVHGYLSVPEGIY